MADILRGRPSKNVIVLKQSVSVSHTVTPCPADYVKETHSGHCYRYVKTRLDWQQAQDNCNTLLPGSYLAEIGSLAENEFVNTLRIG